MAIFADLPIASRIAARSFFEMLAYFVHSDAPLFGGVLAQVKGRVDLFVKNALKASRQGFAQFQTEAHSVSYCQS